MSLRPQESLFEAWFKLIKRARFGLPRSNLSINDRGGFAAATNQLPFVGFMKLKLKL